MSNHSKTTSGGPAPSLCTPFGLERRAAFSLAFAASASFASTLGCATDESPPEAAEEAPSSHEPSVDSKTASPVAVRSRTTHRALGASNLDIRGAKSNALPSAPPSAPPSVVRAIPAGAQVRYSELTGAVSRVTKLGAPLTQPTRNPADEVALQFLKSHGAMFNIAPSDLATAKIVRNYTSRRNGVRHLTVQLQAAGLDVFGSQLKINIDRDGQVINASGEPIPDAEAHVNARSPQLTREDALAVAAQGTSVRRVERSRIKGLVYFPLDSTHLRLAWNLEFDDADSPNAYHVLVDAVDGSLLWRKALTHYQHGEVFVDDSPIPNVPAGTGAGTVARVDVPFDGGQYFTPADVHFDWWAGNPPSTTTSNNVDAYADRDGDDVADTGSRPAAGPGDDFTFAVDFTLAPLAYRDAAVANLFYWNNLLHDFFYDLGFDEAAGNFQTDNFGLGGSAGDAVLAEAQDNADGTPPSLCNANMNTPADGSPPRMQMFLCSFSTPDRDGSFDNVVIGHEYTHGVHSRLLATSGSQRGNEGWADFYGLGMILQPGDPYGGEYGVGNYLFGDASGQGIRTDPYSTDTSVFQLSYDNLPDVASCTIRTCSSDDTETCNEDRDCTTMGDVCTSRGCQTHMECQPPVTSIPQGVCETQVHFAGSIWANALHLVRFNLIAEHGFATGFQTGNQLIMDGMMLSSDDPTFLDGRDALLTADQLGYSGVNRCLIWDAFARMGMGLSASTTGVTDLYPVEGYDVPPDCTPQIDVDGLTDLGETCPGESLTQPLTIENAGSGALIVTAVERVSGSPNIEVDATPELPQVLESGEDAEFTVRCSPTAAGPLSATIRVTSNDPTTPVEDLVYTCSATPLDLEVPDDVAVSFCSTMEHVFVGEATADGCNADVVGHVISTNGVALDVPLEVVDGEVLLDFGTHVIRWEATDGYQVEEAFQTVVVGPAIQADDTYQVRDRAFVEDTAGNPAAVLNSGTGITSIGGDGATVGAIVAAGDVNVSHNGYVFGDITAVGNVLVADPGTHSGSVVPVASVELPPLPGLPAFPPATGGDVWVNPNTDISLAPGSYGSLGVNGNPSPAEAAVVRLSEGDYYFNNLYFNSAGLVVVAELGTNIYVSGNVTFNTSIVTAVGSDELAPVLLGVSGTGALNLQAPFSGTIVAPERNLTVGTANGMTFEGSFYARSIEVTPDSILRCAPRVEASEASLCSNGLLDPGEVDVDCGGSCPPCPVACDTQQYEAEAMFHSTGNAWWEGGWNIYANGYISTLHDFSAGPAEITVLALGQEFNGLPHMVVTVDGSPIEPTAGVSVTAGGFVEYPFTFDALGGTQEIRVSFDNDANGPSGDRNLIVQTVSVSCL